MTRTFPDGWLPTALSAAIALTGPARAAGPAEAGRPPLVLRASGSVTSDSNVFLNDEGRGDRIYGSSLSAEYNRRSGWISIKAGAALESSRFARLRDNDFTDPSARIGLLKEGGRTTGSLELSAARESRADAETGARGTSWYFPVALDARHRIDGASAVAASLEWTSREYLDERSFASLVTRTAALEAVRVTSGPREWSVGYRFRESESSRRTSSTDHAALAGLDGRIIRGLDGTLRAGLQSRRSTGRITGHAAATSACAAGAATWELSSRLRLTGSVTKDFATTATDDVVDALAASVSARYAATPSLTADLKVGIGDSVHVGPAAAGGTAGGPTRADRLASLEFALSWAPTTRWRATAGTGHFRHHSNVSRADFTRSTWSSGVSFSW